MSQLQESIESIQKSSNSIVEIAEKLPDGTIQWKPAPDVWSILEILCHVEEMTPYWADEIGRVVASPGIEWGRGHANEDRLAAVAVAPQRNVKEIIQRIQAGTKKAVTLLGTLRNEDLSIESPSRNPRLGTKPMSFVLDHLLVKHLRDHLGQIQRNLDQLAANDAAAGKN